MRLLLLVAFSILMGCSSCSNGSGSGPDSGTDTGTDGDTDTDTDSDSDTDSDTATVPEGFVPDAGPWDWTDLPNASDCGADCVQLTYTDEVRVLEWDVWGNLLSFNDEAPITHVVNHAEEKQLTIPNVYPAISIGQYSDSANFYPTIYEQTVCYSKLAGNGTVVFSDVICADLDAEIQQLVYHRSKAGYDFPNPAKYSDLYGTRFASMGGCGDVMDSWPLCMFSMESPGTYEEIAPTHYGSHNSMWGDVVVWYKEDSGYNIQGHDFSSGTTFNITDDSEVQFNPRIHGTRVVYQDLRFGSGGTPQTSWAHSAIFMYDLNTHITTQITSGAWIAADPDVHNNIIVWADYRDSADPNNQNSLSGVEIWGYNIDTSTEFKITNLPGRAKTTPRIWGDKVFVHMYKATSGDAIYMFDLPAAK